VALKIPYGIPSALSNIFFLVGQKLFSVKAAQGEPLVNLLQPYDAAHGVTLYFHYLLSNIFISIRFCIF
jgi:hypothetical protein